MKLKTYLRGLGLGIIVTTLIMSIALGGDKEMSDAEVIARAKELGMVEGTEAESGPLLERESIAISETGEDADTELQTETEEEPETQVESETEIQSEVQTEPETEAVSEPETVVEEETIAEEPESESNEESALAEGEPVDKADATDGEIVAGQLVSITIVSGDDSAIVSRRLEEVGLIVSATSYDKFLCDNGYAKKLSPGTYEIAIGSSEETIAKIITKSR